MDRLKSLKKSQLKQSFFLGLSIISLILGIWISACNIYPDGSLGLGLIGCVISALSLIMTLAFLETFPLKSNTIPFFKIGEKVQLIDSYNEFPEVSQFLEILKVGNETYLVQNNQGKLKEILIWNQEHYKLA